MRLEFTDDIFLAHPFTESFEKTTLCKSDKRVLHAPQGYCTNRTTYQDEDDITDDNLNGDTRDRHSTTFYIGLVIKRIQCGQCESLYLYSLAVLFWIV